MREECDTCPYCGCEFELGASACPSCDLPLLTGDIAAPATRGAVVVTAARPEFATGGLRRVAIASNQAEAEMVESLLRSEGIPCIVQRSPGADVPDFLAAGRRDILVPESGLAAARDLLRIEVSETSANDAAPSPLMLAIAVLAGVLMVALCIAVIIGLS